MRCEIPNIGPLDIETVILDLNGTIAIDGVLIEGVKELVEELCKHFRVLLFTGDTHRNGGLIAKELGIEMRLTPDAEAKAEEATKLNPETCAAIGNGRIDLEMFKVVRLPIAVILQECAWTETVNASKIQSTSIIDALNLLLKPKRLIATMRK